MPFIREPVRYGVARAAPRVPFHAMNPTSAEPTHSDRAAPEGGDRIEWIAAIPFFAMHLAPLAAVFTVVTWEDWVLCAALYLVRMFCITAGYHRYFSHRSFRTGRVVQFLLALGGTTALQKGPLWWAGHHRMHHRHSDLDDDLHSPRDGFWWSHVGWILSSRYKATDLAAIRDFAAYPELRLLDRYSGVPPWALGITCFLLGGWGALLIGFCLSTVLLWHGTFVVNSLTHLFGRRRFATSDTSRNSLIIAVVTGGEGWHNNHHYLPASARQGFTWWEFDPTWYGLRGLAALHLVRDLKDPPARLLDQARVRDGAFDIGMFRSYWDRAAKVAGERIADLSARPLGRSAEALATGSEGPVEEPVSETSVAAPSGSHEPLATLAGLIGKALESADQLAASTRRIRRELKTTTTEQGNAERTGE